jgi:hypothetical protein
MTYQRSGELERSESAAPGSVSGILATDGEASDGHILSIDGGELKEGSPMLYGHDVSGERNLGSWQRFERFPYNGGKAIRAHGQIELGGEGDRKAWRNDMAHMIAKEHIGALSIRWDTIDEPIYRTSLPSDHPAHVDRKAKGRKSNGLFFPRWSMQEGSVVTLPADQAAMVGRMAQCDGPVRTFWRSAINDAMTEEIGAEALVAVALPNGEHAYIERAAYEALIELANERMQIALDLHEDTIQRALGAEPLTDTTDSDAGAETQPPAVLAEKREIEAVTLPAITPRVLYGALREQLATSRREADEVRRAGIARARGKLNGK